MGLKSTKKLSSNVHLAKLTLFITTLGLQLNMNSLYLSLSETHRASTLTIPQTLSAALRGSLSNSTVPVVAF